jgi:hypothetical protein
MRWGRGGIRIACGLATFVFGIDGYIAAGPRRRRAAPQLLALAAAG